MLKERNYLKMIFSEPRRLYTAYEEIQEPININNSHPSIIRGNRFIHDLTTGTSIRYCPDGSDGIK